MDGQGGQRRYAFEKPALSPDTCLLLLLRSFFLSFFVNVQRLLSTGIFQLHPRAAEGVTPRRRRRKRKLHLPAGLIGQKANFHEAVFVVSGGVCNAGMRFPLLLPRK